MKLQGQLASIAPDHTIGSNETRSFVLNSDIVEVKSTAVHEYRCSGYLCDRQRVIENGRGQKTCGCYSMNNRMSNVVLVHTVKVYGNNGTELFMNNFSSFRFMSMYLSKDFSSSVKFNHLNTSAAYYDLQECIDEVVDYINENGGFTVVGWYKCGEIHDMSNEVVSTDVESSDIGFHIVSISPTNAKAVHDVGCIEKKFNYSTYIN